MRVPVITCFVGLLLFGFNAEANQCAAIETARVLQFYKYQGVKTEAEISAYSSFRQMVDTQLMVANQALEVPDVSGLSAKPTLASASLFINDTLTPDKAAMLGQKDAKLLELSDGFQTVNSDGSYRILSNIYLVTPASIAPVKPLLYAFDVVTWKYADALRIHIGATYYALALDAKARSCRAVESGMLNRSWEVLQDIHDAGKQIDELRKAVRLAIDSIQPERGSPKP